MSSASVCSLLPPSVDGTVENSTEFQWTYIFGDMAAKSPPPRLILFIWFPPADLKCTFKCHLGMITCTHTYKHTPMWASRWYHMATDAMFCSVTVNYSFELLGPLKHGSHRNVETVSWLLAVLGSITFKSYITLLPIEKSNSLEYFCVTKN